MPKEMTTSTLISEHFDYHPSKPANRVLVVAATPRSGSTFLCLEMWRDGRFGRPWEYFDFSHTKSRMAALLQRAKTDNLLAYVHWLIGKRCSPTGLFATKLMVEHALLLEHSGLFETLPNLCAVEIVRRDVLAQAVSFAKADATNAWEANQKDRQKPTYNETRIHQRLQHISESKALWQGLFQSWQIEPIRVYYEDLVESPSQTLDHLARTLHLVEEKSQEGTLPLPYLQRQRNQINHDWKTQFLDDQQNHRSPAQTSSSQSSPLGRLRTEIRHARKFSQPHLQALVEKALQHSLKGS